MNAVLKLCLVPFLVIAGFPAVPDAAVLGRVVRA